MNGITVEQEKWLKEYKLSKRNKSKYYWGRNLSGDEIPKDLSYDFLNEIDVLYFNELVKSHENHLMINDFMNKYNCNQIIAYKLKQHCSLKDFYKLVCEVSKLCNHEYSFLLKQDASYRKDGSLYEEYNNHVYLFLTDFDDRNKIEHMYFKNDYLG